MLNSLLILGDEPSNRINSVRVDTTLMQSSVVAVHIEVVAVLALQRETCQVVRQQSCGRPVRLPRGADDHQEGWASERNWGKYELWNVIPMLPDFRSLCRSAWIREELMAKTREGPVPSS